MSTLQDVSYLGNKVVYSVIFPWCVLPFGVSYLGNEVVYSPGLRYSYREHGVSYLGNGVVYSRRSLLVIDRQVYHTLEMG